MPRLRSTVQTRAQARERARLVTVAFVILPPWMPARRRAARAHREVGRALQRSGPRPGSAGWTPAHLDQVRVHLVSGALAACTRGPLGLVPWERPFRARDQLRLLPPSVRAAHALRRVELLDRDESTALLALAGVADPATAIRLADQRGGDLPTPDPGAVARAAWAWRRQVATAVAAVVLLPGLLVGEVAAGGSGERTREVLVSPAATAGGGDVAPKRAAVVTAEPARQARPRRAHGDQAAWDEARRRANAALAERARERARAALTARRAIERSLRGSGIALPELDALSR